LGTDRPTKITFADMRAQGIVEAARKVRQTRFVIDGEAVVLGVDGIADFDALHSRKHLDGDDLRRLPLSMRMTNLAQLLARRPDGIFVAPFEQGEIGPDLFRAACDMGLQRSISVECDDQRRLLPHFVLIVLAVKQRY
jgi:bifunctional non-homologous end joining protein LigD